MGDFLHYSLARDWLTNSARVGALMTISDESQCSTDLTDREWSVIVPILPGRWRGRERIDDRKIINGILWRLRTGKPWVAMPSRYGPHMTCVNRFLRWRDKGIWQRIIQAVCATFGDEVQLIDSASIRAFRQYMQKRQVAPDPVAWIMRDTAKGAGHDTGRVA